jgi:DNA-binding CsgD family transcriptional regulator
VNSHVRKVFTKMGVHSRAELATLASSVAPPTPPEG